ncbi:MAG: pitrilysin family protein [Isosphaeraceae bacterium]|nr:pitrilysin family protein [Isosphaeraceae bacterium]
MATPMRIPEISFTKRTLANGLDVIARRQGSLPITAVNLWYHVGSKNEAARQSGFAHLFEHLMFEGSEHYPDDFFSPLLPLGARINGSTSSDRTNYFVDLPTAHVEKALAMESDRMGHFLPALTAEKLRIQKDVVKNEYRQNYANRPGGKTWQILSELLYPEHHPYRHLTIGAMEDVEAAGLDDVESFFRRFYVPTNASLSIVGDLDEERALDLAERWFGSIDGGAAAVGPSCPSVALTSTKRAELRDRVGLDKLYLAWHTVPQFTDGDHALDALADVLARGKSSRLYRKLVMENELLQDVSAWQSGKELAGTFMIHGTLRPGSSLDAVREAFDSEIADLADRGPNPEEMSRIQAQRAANFIYALDRTGGFGGMADRLNAFNVYLRDPGRLGLELERSLAVTPEQVREVAIRYVVGRPRVEFSVRDGDPGKRIVAPDRSVPPASAVSTAYEPPTPKAARLSNGTTLCVIERPELPIVAATLMLPGGAASHSAELGGLAQLTVDLLDEGTERRDAHAIATALESLGTQLSIDCGWDGVYLGLQCLSTHFAQSLEVVTEIAIEPSFPETDFQRIKGRTLAAFQAARNRAEKRVARVFAQEIFGPSHPFGIPIEGTESTVSALSRDMLRMHHESSLRAESAVCVVAGDVRFDDAAGILELLLDHPRFHSGQASRPAPTSPDLAAAPRIVLLDDPGARQAVVKIGHLGTDRLAPDHDALSVANLILGGQFNSRLNTKIREEKGLTYGIRSTFDFRRSTGPFLISSSLQADKIHEALAEIRHEIRAFLDHRPPTPTEVEEAKRSIIEGQARLFETPAALVSRFAHLFVHDLPLDEYRRLPARIAQVDPASAIAAARRAIRPDSLIFVVAADAAQARPLLESLDWAEVEVRGREAGTD